MTAVMAKVYLVIVNVVFLFPSPAAQSFSSREMVFDTIVNTLPRYKVESPWAIEWAILGKVPRSATG
jgi:hypothetical protein